jgi:tripartite-type tricarboxylate transporter receptor subunit TctC
VAPALTDLMGAHVALMFCPMASVVGLAREGQVHALAVTGAERSPLFPQLPTVAEAGLSGYDAELHYGLVAPAGTPGEIIAKLNTALNDALADAEIHDRLAVDGAVTRPGTPQAYADDIAAEQAKWSVIIEKTGVTAQ